MIKSFGCKQTELIWNANQLKSFPIQIQNAARRKLRMINNSIDVNDLRIPPANHLEKLKGNLAGLYSVRINKQWRIIFTWSRGNAGNVRIVDYH
ncbi:MAG: plasmid maintenance system killer family protein [Bacteroidetes bacterium]|nr:plasmid maintenance system killer family protein [Bacteroidota bacterium]